MSLPYENASSGKRALDDLHTILSRFGCTRFGTMTDTVSCELIVQFTYHGRDVSARANYWGYAVAWLREHPHSPRMHCTRVEHERKAMEQAQVSVCSVLRDWIKGQVVAVETGILSFDAAFLGQIMLPATGKTVLETLGEMNVLPALPAATGGAKP